MFKPHTLVISGAVISALLPSVLRAKEPPLVPKTTSDSTTSCIGYAAVELLAAVRTRCRQPLRWLLPKTGNGRSTHSPPQLTHTPTTPRPLTQQGWLQPPAESSMPLRCSFAQCGHCCRKGCRTANVPSPALPGVAIGAYYCQSNACSIPFLWRPPALLTMIASSASPSPRSRVLCASVSKALTAARRVMSLRRRSSNTRSTPGT